jgi:hypothetical protein
MTAYTTKGSLFLLQLVCYVTYSYPYRSLSPVIIRVWSVLHNIAGEAGKKKTNLPLCRPRDELTNYNSISLVGKKCSSSQNSAFCGTQIITMFTRTVKKVTHFRYFDC